MSDRFERFTARTIIADNDWRIDVGNPYVGAYTAAYASYKETLDRQKETDKEAGTLFVTAACVVTGSFLLGSIGKVSMQMIAKRTVVQVANSSLMGNFSSVFKVARKNEGVTFALGKLVDSATGSLKTNAEKIAASYLQTASNVLSPEPLVQLLQMDSFMRANVNCGLKMAQAIEQNCEMSEPQKDAAYATLLAAPLYGKPKKRTSKYPASLSELIELSFYLSAILETDRLVSWPVYVPNAGNVGKTSSAAIGQRPNAPNYPRPVTPAPGAFGVTPAHQSVAIARAGGDVQKRTNELCTKVFSKPLYSSTFFGLGGPADTLKDQELRQADTFLTELATMMKPLSPLDAIH